MSGLTAPGWRPGIWRPSPRCQSPEPRPTPWPPLVSLSPRPWELALLLRPHKSSLGGWRPSLPSGHWQRPPGRPPCGFPSCPPSDFTSLSQGRRWEAKPGLKDLSAHHHGGAALPGRSCPPHCQASPGLSLRPSHAGPGTCLRRFRSWPSRQRPRPWVDRCWLTASPGMGFTGPGHWEASPGLRTQNHHHTTVDAWGPQRVPHRHLALSLSRAPKGEHLSPFTSNSCGPERSCCAGTHRPEQATTHPALSLQAPRPPPALGLTGEALTLASGASWVLQGWDLPVPGCLSLPPLCTAAPRAPFPSAAGNSGKIHFPIKPNKSSLNQESKRPGTQGQQRDGEDGRALASGSATRGWPAGPAPPQDAGSPL